MDDDDEKELLEASSTNITVDNTAIFCTSDSDMTKEEWEATLVVRESIDSATNLDAHPVSDRAVGEVYQSTSVALVNNHYSADLWN